MSIFPDFATLELDADGPAENEPSAQRWRNRVESQTGASADELIWKTPEGVDEIGRASCRERV